MFFSDDYDDYNDYDDCRLLVHWWFSNLNKQSITGFYFIHDDLLPLNVMTLLPNTFSLFDDRSIPVDLCGEFENPGRSILNNYNDCGVTTQPINSWADWSNPWIGSLLLASVSHTPKQLILDLLHIQALLANVGIHDIWRDMIWYDMVLYIYTLYILHK